MAVDFSLLRSPDIGGALQAGFQMGREQKRQQVVQSALAGFAANPSDAAPVSALMAADPMLGMRLQDRQREQERIDARRAVFAPPSASAGAPETLLDPAALPPRTDGLQINPDALRRLYQIDPDSALDVQKTIYNADAASAKRMKESGELLATAAYRLSKLPLEQRPAELQAMMPQLTSLGLDPRQIAGADLSDQSLDRFMTIGRSIGDVMKEDDAKYIPVPAGGTLVNVRDPRAVASLGSGTSAPIQPGAVVNGKTFRGGDYRDPANWTGGAAPAASATFP